MNAPLSDRANMTDAEWKARCDLAALYRISDMYGWTDTIDTHMTVRVPGEPKCFLINNYGDNFEEITASSLVKMDIDGNVYAKDGKFNAAGFTIHSGVYKARPDANCVMHTHTRAGTGVSVLRQGLRPITQDALSVYDDLVYHEYHISPSGSVGPGTLQFREWIVVSPRAIRRLARRLAPATIEELCLVMTADASGRPPKPAQVPPTVQAIRDQAASLALTDAAPKPILLGRRAVGVCHFGSFRAAMEAAQHLVALGGRPLDRLARPLAGRA